MSRLTLIVVVAISLLLIGASAVFAQTQDSTPGNSVTTPMGPGYMGSGTMMNGVDTGAMQQAMQNGDWQAMHDACQQAWQNGQNQTDQNQTSGTTSRGSARGSGRGMMSRSAT